MIKGQAGWLAPFLSVTAAMGGRSLPPPLHEEKDDDHEGEGDEGGLQVAGKQLPGSEGEHRCDEQKKRQGQDSIFHGAMRAELATFVQWFHPVWGHVFIIE
jgi:hypothetical protein